MESNNNRYKSHQLRWPFFVVGLIIVFGLVLPINTNAQDLIYQPQNPSFGGNPLNFSNFLNAANLQNKFQDNNSFGQTNTLLDFQESLQRQILSQLTRQIVSEQFGADIDLEQNQTFEFGEFNINVNPGTNGVSIVIRNILTGESTSITIPTNY